MRGSSVEDSPNKWKSGRPELGNDKNSFPPMLTSGLRARLPAEFGMQAKLRDE